MFQTLLCKVILSHVIAIRFKFSYLKRLFVLEYSNEYKDFVSILKFVYFLFRIKIFVFFCLVVVVRETFKIKIILLTLMYLHTTI